MSHAFTPIQKADLVWKDNRPFSQDYDDIYHAAESGIEQCRHVFIKGNEIAARISQHTHDSFTIGETGFGCGLNFLTTWALWRECAPNTRLHFISCEKHPLKKEELIQALAHWPELNELAQELQTNYPVLTPGFHHLSFDNGKVLLTLLLGDALDCFEQLLHCKEPTLEASLRTTFMDAWYLDGFCPAKNESMWSESLFQVIALLSKPGTTLATYTARAQVKSGLLKVGFEVTKDKGFGPKRHMVKATFVKATQGLKPKNTPWHVATPYSFQSKKAIVVGAGLSGCFMARQLADKGWEVTLIEAESTIAQGASANTQAVLFPLLSAYRSPLSQLMLESFLYATRVYKAILKEQSFGELKGALLLAYNDKERKAQAQLIAWLQAYPELGVLVDSKEASQLAGLPLDHSGLYVPNSGWLDSRALCQCLINHENITLESNQRVNELTYSEDNWQVLGMKAPVLVLTNGFEARQFEQTKTLPIKSIKGQMTLIKATSQSDKLKIPLCGEGHVLPAHDGLHSVGATYHLANACQTISQDDNAINCAKLNTLSKDTNWSEDLVSAWAGVRATTPDYLPLVGPVAKAEEFEMLFSKLRSDSNRWISSPGSYYPGLYICTGFGSRGLTTIPLCTQWLASSINQEMDSISRELIQAISPARFLRRDIVRGNVAP